MRSSRVVDLRKRPMRSMGHAPRLPFSDKKPRLPLRARRMRLRIALALAALVAFAGAAWGTSYLSYLPSLTVSTVSVSGTRHLSARLVEDMAETYLWNGSSHFLSRQNIFLYNPKNLARNIEGFFPRVQSAQVSRASLFATAVAITIVERQPYALWCPPTQAGLPTQTSPPAQAGDSADTSHCYEMDETGFIFAEAQDASTTTTRTSPYSFRGGLAAENPIGQRFAPSHFPGILALLQLLRQGDSVPLGARLVNDQDFEVPLAAGYFLKASFGEDAIALIRNLQLVLSSEALSGKENQLEYIDLRFGDRVYYKLKGETGEHQ